LLASAGPDHADYLKNGNILIFCRGLGPKGRDRIAQGNALGTGNVIYFVSPERAK
jgi:hypothetical protein